ncbi:hypothetical protein HY439_02075 [Candidatus Microgenomates bacterium]|nr:hypothetical protein [Candidatus Microgenomates bacterium]
MSGGQPRGFLQMCADRRFHSEVEEKFQEATGLPATGYWIEATAGGAPAIDSTKTADYAYAHGARQMGWAAHGSNCGGFPGVGDGQMRVSLEKTVKTRMERYPDAQHFQIFSVEKEDGSPETVIGKVENNK